MNVENDEVVDLHGRGQGPAKRRRPGLIREPIRCFLQVHPVLAKKVRAHPFTALLNKDKIRRGGLFLIMTREACEENKIPLVSAHNSLRCKTIVDDTLC